MVPKPTGVAARDKECAVHRIGPGRRVVPRAVAVVGHVAALGVAACRIAVAAAPADAQLNSPIPDVHGEGAVVGTGAGVAGVPPIY